MDEKLRRKLADLEQEMSYVRGELKRNLSEIYELEGKRRNLLLKIRGLKAEIASCRSKLNVLREEIRGLNESLSRLKKERDEKIASIKEVKEKIREYLKMGTQKGEKYLEMEISNFEWIIQTTPLPLDEEKRIIAKIKSLEEQLYSCRRLRSLKDNVQSMENSVKEIKERISTCAKEIAERSSEKRKIRERLVELTREINEIKCEIDKINREYDDKIAKISELCSRQRELFNQIVAIKRTIKEEEEKRKSEQELMLKEKIKSKVLEKIKHGEKVSLEEFKIFLEDSAADKI